MQAALEPMQDPGGVLGHEDHKVPTESARAWSDP
jgi:hypothetical protein